MTSTEPNPTETRPWVLPKVVERTQVEAEIRRRLNDAEGRAFLFALLCDANAWDQTPTAPDFGARLLSQLVALNPLAVGAMWAEAMNAVHAQRIEKKQ